MIRTSFLAKSLVSSRYLVNHKKPAVQLPIHKPPKYVYHIKYHPTAPPTFDQGFRDHNHSNPFNQAAMNEFELYQFSYSGQWWYIGNIIPKLLTIAFPFWMYYELDRYDQLNEKYGKQGASTWSHVADIRNSSFIVANTL